MLYKTRNVVYNTVQRSYGEVFHCTACSFRLADAYYVDESVKLLADENKIKYKVV